MKASESDLTLSVVIPTHDRIAVLKEALRHLAAGSVAPDEVIVVDDGSEPAVEPDLQSSDYPFELKVIRFSPGRGAPAARNAGMTKARGDVLVMIDDDIWVDYEAIRYHKQIHARHAGPECAVMGRIYFDPDLKRTPMMHYLEEFGGFRSITKAEDRSVVRTGLISANFSLKRSFIEGKRLFDENFPFNRNEDTEFGLRMMEEGLELRFYIAPSARHHSPLSMESHFKQARQGGFSKAYWSLVRPDDTRNCLLLGPAAKRWMRRDAFERLFDQYAKIFDPEFLDRDAGQCSAVEMEKFGFFIKSATGWVQNIGLIDGWIASAPGFEGAIEDVAQAVETRAPHRKLDHLREAVGKAPDFFPLALLYADQLIGSGELEESRRTLQPFESVLWARLKLAEVDLKRKDYDACLDALREIYRRTGNGKAVEQEQRDEAARIGLKLLSKKAMSAEDAAKIWPELTEKDFYKNRDWALRLGGATASGGKAEDDPVEKKFGAIMRLEALEVQLGELDKKSARWKDSRGNSPASGAEAQAGDSTLRKILNEATKLAQGLTNKR